MRKYFTDAASFEMDQWRNDLAFRRIWMRNLALDTIRRGAEHIDAALAYARAVFKYFDLTTADQLLIRKNLSYVRQIVNGWAELDSELQAQFVHGHIPPSTLVTRMKRGGSRSL